MKKKIINGILVTAMLFAASTSFVSCKDNVDDEIANVYVDMNSLQSKIDDLNGKLNTLEGAVSQNTQEIANLKAQLASLQSQLDDLKGQVNANTEAIEKLKTDLAALEEKVDSLFDLIKSLVTGVTVRQTIDPVVGSINLPGYNVLFLGAYVGKNETEMEEFPVAGNDDFNADPDGRVLAKAEIGVDPIKVGKVLAAEEEEEADEPLIMETENNAGTLYFSLNPIDVDASKLTFDLVNSLGTVSPVEITNVQQSAHVVTPSAGKHEGATDGEEATPYLYSAEANIPLNYSKDLPWNQEVNSKVLMDDFIKIFNTAYTSVKKGETASLITNILIAKQQFYQDLYKGLTAKQYQNLRVTYSDENGNERIITSPENIVTATVTPLSYKDIRDFDVEVLGNAKVYLDRKVLESAAGLVAKTIKEKFNQKFPNFDVTKLYIEKIVPTIDGDVIYLVVASNEKEVTIAIDEDGDVAVVDGDNDDLEWTSKDLTSLFKGFYDAINGKIEVANSYLTKALAKYQAVKGNASSYIDRAATYVEKMVNDAIGSLNFTAMGVVEPILLTDTDKGIQRVTEWMQLTSVDGLIQVVLTSYTDEALVPAFKKYIAVKDEKGNIVDAQVHNGTVKFVELKVPEDGIYSIVTQVADFTGHVVTNEVNIIAKEKAEDKK